MINTLLVNLSLTD